MAANTSAEKAALALAEGAAALETALQRLEGESPLLPGESPTGDEMLSGDDSCTPPLDLKDQEALAKQDLARLDGMMSVETRYANREGEDDLGGTRLGRFCRIPTDQITVRADLDREPSHWKSPAYKKLKLSIEHGRGNAIPIMVRPKAGAAEDAFEVISGHRRYRACRELGLLVSALVVRLDEEPEVIRRAITENSLREDLCSYDKGRFFAMAKENGAFASDRDFAVSVGVSHSFVSKCIRLANLPEVVIEAFPSPADVSSKWASELALAFKTNPLAVQDVAEAIKFTREPSDPAKIRELLLDAGLPARERQRVVEILGRKTGDVLAVIKVPRQSSKTGISVQLMRGAADPDELEAVLRKLLDPSGP